MEKLNSAKQSICNLCADNVILHEISEEFVLPDYIPEIKKLLLCKAQALPESRFIAENEIESTGSVTYNVIYTDDDGNLCATPLSSSYEIKIPVRAENAGAFIDISVENAQARANGPRRLSIKSRLKARTLCLKSTELSENISPKSSADEMYLQRKTAQIQDFEILSATQSDITVSDAFDMSSRSVAKPLWCDAAIVIKEHKILNSRMNVRADATVKCICQGENEIFTLSKTVPIEKSIELDGAAEGMMSRAMARCISLSISNEQNSSTSQLFFDLGCEIEAEALKKRVSSITLDCFSTKYPTTQSYKNVNSLYCPCMALNIYNFSASAKRKSNEKLTLIDQMASPVCEKLEIKENKAQISGKIQANLILQNEQGEYLCESYDMPFKQELELNGTPNSVIYRAQASMGIPSVRLDSDKVTLSAELSFGTTIFDQVQTLALDEAKINKDEAISKNPAKITVYFPKSGDTLWEIAKKYSTTVNNICSANDITEGEDITSPLVIE